jgi:outer membrane protein TolC
MKKLSFGPLFYTFFNFVYLLFLNFQSGKAFGQDTLTLETVIRMAQEASPYYRFAKNSYEKEYWRYQNFKAEYRPNVRLKANIPTFYREINPVTQPDGSILFRRVSQANNSVGLTLNQNIALTGGTLSVGTSLQRTDNFLGNEASYFLSTPFTISYHQSSLLYNSLRWRKKIEPLHYEFSVRKFSQDIENAAFSGASLFFDAAISNSLLQFSCSNLAISDSLYDLSLKRFNIGTISSAELMLVELNAVKAKNRRNQNVIKQQIAEKTLRRILGIVDLDTLIFDLPSPPRITFIEYADALEYAKTNKPDLLEFRKRRIEADQEIAKVKGESGIELGVLANLGTQQSSPQIYGAYQNLQNQQYIGVSLDIPIKDWGFRKSQIRLAQASKELTEATLEQEELNFEQTIFLKVMEFNQQNEQYQLAHKADKIASARFDITRKRYLLGQVTVTDLHLAQQESIATRENLIEALRTYWICYFTVRQLTLHDFVSNKSLLQTLNRLDYSNKIK